MQPFDDELSCIAHALCDTVPLPGEEEVLCEGFCDCLNIPIDRSVLNAVQMSTRKEH